MWMRALRDRGLEAELADARNRIGELQAQLAQLSTRDPIAGDLLTLKAFRAQLDLDVKRAHRYRRPLGLALIDLDGFRALNARHGYATGDEIIGGVGKLISDETRVHDLACRTGGDEFAVLLPETEGDGCIRAMDRILEKLEGFAVGEVRGMSASIGIAALEGGETPAELLAAA